MNIRIPILCFLLFPLIGSLSLHAQKKEKGSEKSMIRIIARPVKEKGEILLRWAVSDAQAWKYTNQHGFILERYTVIRDKKMLATPEKKLISMYPIKPKPLYEWKNIAQRDKYAAVIAQALYGKDFQMTGGDASGIAKIVAQSQELEQRYMFSLYAADMSFEAAKYAGWGYTDTDVQPNEKYFYRIKLAIPSAILKMDSTGVFIGIADAEPLPKMSEVVATFSDKTVMLSWDGAPLNNYYNTYIIEKSLDGGKHFHRLPGVPVTNLNDKEGRSSSRLYFIDSLRDNTINYQYRVKGINPFGETGPPSDVVSGKGRSVLAYVPNIQQSYVDEKGALQLQWEFDEKGNQLITGFTLSRADGADGPYRVLMENIPVTQRRLTYDRVQATNYFTITAVPKEGEPRTSFPVLIQPIDSIPPAVPRDLMALIDSNGVVQLKWKANEESDLLGYKIFRALKKNEELVPLIDSVWYVNNYQDMLSLKLLNKKTYYAIAAVDHRYNQSAPSALVEVKKPSIIPPSPAVITRYKAKDGKIILNWINSSDEDIVAHALYRKKEGQAAWALVKEFEGKSVHTYIDEDTEGGHWYNYVLEARSEAGLKTRSEVLMVQAVGGARERLVLTRLYAYPKVQERYIEVVWDDALAGVASYQVYKATGNGSLSLWKEVEADQKGFYDTEVQPNTQYQYGVMAVLKSGAYSAMKTVTVKY